MTKEAARATKDGLVEPELLPVAVDRGEGPTGETMTADEGIRPDSTVESLGGLRPAFWSDELASSYPDLSWVVTAGGASQISDGAAAVLVMERGAVADWLARPEVVAMQADWTRPDKAIADYLARYERYGIPFNIIYGPEAPQGRPLPELLSASAVLGAAAAATGEPALARR